ncbi:hypothetical protein OKW41_003927 [Paraburkholderia sp. UCT70]
MRFDEFAKRLARHVDVAKHLAAGANPAVEAAREQRDLCIAERRQLVGGARGKSFTGVEQNDRHVAARQTRIGVEFEFRQRKIGREQRMSLRMRVFFAHVQQRDLTAREQRFAHVFVGANRIGRHQ